MPIPTLCSGGLTYSSLMGQHELMRQHGSQAHWPAVSDHRHTTTAIATRPVAVFRAAGPAEAAAPTRHGWRDVLELTETALRQANAKENTELQRWTDHLTRHHGGGSLRVRTAAG